MLYYTPGGGRGGKLYSCQCLLVELFQSRLNRFLKCPESGGMMLGVVRMPPMVYHKQDCVFALVSYKSMAIRCQNQESRIELWMVNVLFFLRKTILLSTNKQ